MSLVMMFLLNVLLLSEKSTGNVAHLFIIASLGSAQQEFGAGTDEIGRYYCVEILHAICSG